MVLEEFVQRWQEAVGAAQVTRLSCGCWAGPCPCCMKDALVVGVANGPCGGPDQPHEARYLPLKRLAALAMKE